MGEGKFDEAITAFKEAGENAVEKVKSAFEQKGDSLLGEGKFDDAIASFREAGENAVEKLKDAFDQKGTALLGEGKFDEAIEAFRQAGEKAVERLKEAFGRKGSSLLNEGKFDEAIAAFKEAGEAFADHLHMAYDQKGTALLSDGKIDEAIAAYEQAGDVSAENLREAYLAKGQQLLDNGEFDEALEALAYAGDKGVEAAKSVHYAKADSLVAQGMLEEAGDEYDLAGDYGDAASKRDKTYLTRVQALRDAHRFDEATELYNRMHSHEGEEIHYPGQTDMMLANRRLNFAVGSEVTFGRQENGDPITWIVLEQRESRYALLLSRDLLAPQRFTVKKPGEQVAWKTSTLRNWLNRDFFRSAFSAEEQRAICSWQISTRQSSQSDWTDMTNDKVFILSADEAAEYLENLQAALAASAQHSAATQDSAGHAWWWLRTPGRENGQAEAVSLQGEIRERDAYTPTACVRPAIWVDLFDDQF